MGTVATDMVGLVCRGLTRFAFAHEDNQALSPAGDPVRVGAHGSMVSWRERLAPGTR